MKVKNEEKNIITDDKKLPFVMPEMEIIRFGTVDVITASGDPEGEPDEELTDKLGFFRYFGD